LYGDITRKGKLECGNQQRGGLAGAGSTKIGLQWEGNDKSMVAWEALSDSSGRDLTLGNVKNNSIQRRGIFEQTPGYAVIVMLLLIVVLPMNMILASDWFQNRPCSRKRIGVYLILSRCSRGFGGACCVAFLRTPFHAKLFWSSIIFECLFCRMKFLIFFSRYVLVVHVMISYLLLIISP
jgi:hypothetical protein